MASRFQRRTSIDISRCQRRNIHKKFDRSSFPHFEYYINVQFEGMFSEEREQKLKERLLAAFELARTAKLKPKTEETHKSKSWFSGLIDQKVELVKDP